LEWFKTGKNTIMMRSFFSLILICITFMHASAYGAATATDNKLLLDKENPAGSLRCMTAQHVSLLYGTMERLQEI
jgi:hypothetical protein